MSTPTPHPTSPTLRVRIYRYEQVGPERLVFEGERTDPKCPIPFKGNIEAAEALGPAIGHRFIVGRGDCYFAVVVATPTSGGWFTTYECHCHAVERARANLPRQCPGHQAGEILSAEYIARPDGEPMQIGHRCGTLTDPCIPGEVTPYRRAVPTP